MRDHTKPIYATKDGIIEADVPKDGAFITLTPSRPGRFAQVAKTPKPKKRAKGVDDGTANQT